jgi:hypothetical protein
MVLYFKGTKNGYNTQICHDWCFDENVCIDKGRELVLIIIDSFLCYAIPATIAVRPRTFGLVDL